ncbi:MAG TPA: HAD-IIB family hydrolase [Verrucomicrobiae bacterium]|nr:HAD-IIB family hydrolase [Verrucomicrobiae bacterium]
MSYSLRPGPNYRPNTPITIEVCFFDIDNTLISNDSAELPSKRFQQISRKAGKNTLIGVATARSLQRAQHILDAIGSNSISILSNGAVLYDAASKKIVVDNSLPLDATNELIREFRRRTFSYEVQDDGIDYTWAYPAGNAPGNMTYTSAIDPLHPQGPRRKVPDYTPRHPRILCATVFSDVDVERVHALASKYADKDVTSLVGHTTLLAGGKTKYEIFVVHKNANKQWAMAKALEILGIPAKNALAVADGHNDLALMQMAGIGVAVDNAVPEVLANATFIAPSQEDDGAATALEQLIKL